MNKKFLILIFMAATSTLYAQEKRLNVYSTYVFDDKFDTYYSSTDYYTGKIIGGYQWGAGFEFKPNRNVGAELLYLHQDTQAPVQYYNIGAVNRTLDIGVNYYLLGINRYMPTGNEKVEPYGGVLLGAVGYVNKNPAAGEPTSSTRFALGFRLGATIWASAKVGIKLQAQFLSSVQGVGGGFYFGTGGSGAGVSTYSTITQLGLGGGLVFKLGQ